jgi:hypothetical protein
MVLRVFRYTRYAWLVFIPVGTVIGILCIMYLRGTDSQSEKGVGKELRSQDNPVDAEPTVDG